MRRTCKLWQQFSTAPVLWRSACIRDWLVDPAPAGDVEAAAPLCDRVVGVEVRVAVHFAAIPE